MIKKKKTFLDDFHRNVLLLAAQLVLFVGCAYYVDYVYLRTVVPDERVTEEFGISTCTITNKNMVTSSGIGKSYRADFDVAYIANGSEVRSVAAANGLDYSYTRDKDSQQAYLDEFTVGDEYPCWYDKEKPTSVVLVLRHQWNTTLPLIIPVIIALIILFFIFRTIFEMLEDSVVKRKRK